nr:IPT/TIG domain-containing protein [Nitrospirota bacterium]
MRSMDSCAIRFDLRPMKALSFAIALLLAGCAGSGDVEQVRQERAQAKAKMSAELQQERTLAATMEKDSAAKRASADKLAAALGGTAGSKTTARASGSGTTLQITNATSNPVPVMITLGAGYGIKKINDLPWGVVQDPVGIQDLQGIFILAGNSSVSYNSGTSSFSGNVAFGPTSWGRGCGNPAAGACYPNSTNLAEFTLNYSQGMETVDISDVNGANAAISINFTGSNQWNNNSGDNNVTNIPSVLPLSAFAQQSGVYGWQATNCINVVLPVPNGPPSNICAAPVNNPGAPQLQTNAQCNIQRGVGVSGGTVEIVFNGFTDAPSAPQLGCMAVYTISPASGSQNGGTTVTMTGWGLSQVTGVTFQGAQATISSQSNTQLVVTTPACNFCGGSQPWNSNIMLNGSYTVPSYAAGWGASAAYVYTSN